MNALLDRWNSLSRAMRWAIAAAAVVGIYLGVVEPAIDYTNKLVGQADQAEAKLKNLSGQAALQNEAVAKLQRASRGMGRVTPPELLLTSDQRRRAEEEGNAPLTAAQRISDAQSTINSVLDDLGARSIRISAGNRQSISSRDLPGFEANRGELQRAVFDVSFTATPERVAEVITELERTPGITTLGEITLRRVDNGGARLVQAELAPEVWVVDEKGGRR